MTRVSSKYARFYDQPVTPNRSALLVVQFAIKRGGSVENLLVRDQIYKLLNYAV